MPKITSRLLLLFFLFLFLAKRSCAQKGNQQIIAQFDSLNRAMPREKLYVHFDKTLYTQLDTIWFKAYLFDESLKTASTQSGLIYAEMIDTKGTIIKTVSLPTGAGLTWGGFALDQKSYAPGTYTFRAYTNWMQNFGDRYLFKKELKIVDLLDETPVSANYPTSNTTNPSNKTSTSNPSKLSDIDLQFLPEGGNWVANRVQLVAFKAISPNGKGMDLQGDIVDSKQNTVASFYTNKLGMGYFTMTPKFGETYTAVITRPLGIKNEILPKVLQNGVTLQVRNSFSSDSLTITVTSDLGEELSLVGQSRGLVSFVTKIKANVTRKILTVSKNIFPSGISQITIFNAVDKPINERSFFINHDDQLQITTSTGAASFGIRDSIPMRLTVNNAGGLPIVGSFSMSVTDDQQVFKDSINNGNILSYLLLTSDLKGEIENPGNYFHQFNEQKHNDLEALVLTQGWASYLTQPKKTAPYKVEKDFTISGNVTNLSNKPIAAKVSLIGTNRSKTIALQTIANEKGEFVFDKLPAIDSASFVIQALTSKDKRGTLGIALNEFKRPPFQVAVKKAVFVPGPKPDSISENLVKVQKQAYYRGDGVALKEVNISGKKVVKNSKNQNGPGESDQVIAEEELDKVAKKSLYEVLMEKVPGFHASTLRMKEDKAFFIKNNPVKIIIDGMDVDYFYTEMGVRDDHYRHIMQYLDYYKAEDVLGIEVMSSIYNVANYNATFTTDPTVYQDPIRQGDFRSYLEITTKTGSGPFLKKAANMYMLKPNSYGDLKVFYSPKYTSANKTTKTSDLRSTIYWAPNLVTNEKGEANTSFFSADKKGTYTVWIEGSDMQGHIGMKTMTVKIN
jgi:hypothetical protein